MYYDEIWIVCQVLNDAHRRLTAVAQERQRVLDLTNQAVPSVGGQSDYVNLLNVKPSLRKQAFCSSNPNSVSSGVHSDDPLFRPDQLGPYTPDCHFSLEDGRITRERSEHLRMESSCLQQKTRDMMRSSHEAVNKGLLQKITETTNLKVIQRLVHMYIYCFEIFLTQFLYQAICTQRTPKGPE